MDPAGLSREIFRKFPEVRYVATYVNGALSSAERADLQNATASESDKYEELIVNPTLLKLVGQRGAIDCGGVEYVLVRYGNFFQFIHPLGGGHISVAIDDGPAVMGVVAGIRGLPGFQAGAPSV